MENLEDWKKLYNEVGSEKLWDIVFEEALKAQGITTEEWVAKHISGERPPMTEVEELKIDLEFSKLDSKWLQDELDETKQKLASIEVPAPIQDASMFFELKKMMGAILDNTATIKDDTNTIKMETGNIHRVFNTPPSPEPKKRLTQKQKIEAEIQKRIKENELKIAQTLLKKTP